MKKRLLSVLLAFTLCLGLAACGKMPPPNTELTVFAAASLTETLNQVAALYKTAAPDITLTFNFDSSGTLQTQLEEGADCDVFLSAAEKQMDALDGEGLLLAGSRVDLLQNELVLVAPKGNPANIRTFEDAARADSVALGNSDVPAGQYAREIFTNLGLWTEDFLSRVTLASNVKEVVSWVSEGAVDCGVVYKTDAKAAGLEIAASAPEGSLDTPVLYPAAVLANSANPGAALAFLAFLRSDEATAIFENAGFAIPQ